MLTRQFAEMFAEQNIIKLNKTTREYIHRIHCDWTLESSNIFDSQIVKKMICKIPSSNYLGIHQFSKQQTKLSSKSKHEKDNSIV